MPIIILKVVITLAIIFYVFYATPLGASSTAIKILLGILATMFLIYCYVPVNKYISHAITDNKLRDYPPLADDFSSRDSAHGLEITHLTNTNSQRLRIWFDKKQQLLFVFCIEEDKNEYIKNPYHTKILKLNQLGQVIDSFDEPFDFPGSETAPILTNREQNIYYDWMETGNKIPKPLQLHHVTESMSLKDWKNKFIELYEKATQVTYLKEDHRRLFKINAEWHELEENEAVDASDLRIYSKRIDPYRYEEIVTVDNYPAKESDSLSLVFPQIYSYDKNNNHSEPKASIDYFSKDYFEWPTGGPGLPLPIIDGFIWFGTACVKITLNQKTIKFSVPAEYHLKKFDYLLPFNLEYWPESNPTQPQVLLIYYFPTGKTAAYMLTNEGHADEEQIDAKQNNLEKNYGLYLARPKNN